MDTTGPEAGTAPDRGGADLPDSRHRFAVFLTVVLSVWVGMHVYVGSRLLSLPQLAGWRPLVVIGLVVLSMAYLGARLLERSAWRRLAPALGWIGGLWVGALFQLLVCLLAVDLVTGFGHLLPAAVPGLRLGAVALAAVLTAAGVAQASRRPAVVEHEVVVPGLPAERDGTVVVQLTDLHLGATLGRDWLSARNRQVAELEPDLIALTGDVLDGDPGDLRSLLPALAELDAPLGVWAVTGNHEYYAGVDDCVQLFEDAGYRTLRDAHAEVVPGLILAGVDDLTARRQLGVADHALGRSLDGRLPGATVLLSHSPLQVEAAARHGVGLMLSGHTHGGQIWPFRHLVELAYPYVAGRYAVGAMTLVVSTGTGTWGPRMRLPGRSEIHRITLRSERAEP